MLSFFADDADENCHQNNETADHFLGKGVAVDDEVYRAHHLLGLPLPGNTHGEALVEELQARKVFVSLRGDNIRISINVFNTTEDVSELISALNP